MLSLYDKSSNEAALRQPLEPALRALLTVRLDDARASELADLTHILVVQAGDSEDAICHEIGFSPLSHPIDGARYGSPDFNPYWSWLEAHSGWYELIVTVGDSGFAFIVLVERAAGVLPTLLAMCDGHAIDGAT